MNRDIKEVGPEDFKVIRGNFKRGSPIYLQMTHGSFTYRDTVVIFRGLQLVDVFCTALTGGLSSFLWGFAPVEAVKLSLMLLGVFALSRFLYEAFSKFVHGDGDSGRSDR